jgi:hypothetical protein
MLTSARLKAAAFKGLINEHVMQQIWEIDNIPLPFSDLVGSGSCSNSYTEWVTDKLQAVNIANAKIDGSDTNTVDDTQVGSRVGNQCQISTKNVQVSSRSQASSVIGGDPRAYQIMMRQRELRRDVEAIALIHQTSVADDGTAVAGKCGSFPSFLVTNTFRGATGANGGFSAGVVTKPTEGTVRALTETLIRDCAQSIYTQGGNPSVLMSSPGQIRKLSEYMFGASARIATLTATTDADGGAGSLTAKGSVNVFITDFGVVLEMVANRLQQTVAANNVDVLLIDPEYVELAYLRGYQTEPLAKSGLGVKDQMSVDWTVRVLNESAHGVVADCNPTLTVTT